MAPRNIDFTGNLLLLVVGALSDTSSSALPRLRAQQFHLLPARSDVEPVFIEKTSIEVTSYPANEPLYLLALFHTLPLHIFRQGGLLHGRLLLAAQPPEPPVKVEVARIERDLLITHRVVVQLCLSVHACGQVGPRSLIVHVLPSACSGST